MDKLNFVEWISGVLLAIGGLNWGLVGFFNYDLLAKLFTDGSSAYRFITAIVGLGALYLIGDVVYRVNQYQQHHHAHA